MKALLILFIVSVLGVNVLSQTSQQQQNLAQSNTATFDAFAKSIEELITKQHGEQHFNDHLTNTQHNAILDDPAVLQSERELDELLNKLHSSYTKVQSQTKTQLIPTLVYESKTQEQIAADQKAKELREQERVREEQAKLPKNCTLTTPDGTICAGGKCFQGKCRATVPCYDQCCDDFTFPKLNGTPCAGGECIQGQCTPVLKCYGDCCDKTNTTLLPDGTKCSIGVCKNGGCVAEKVGCVSGACCDEVNGIVRPKGFKCHVNHCQKSSECSGYSEQCPDNNKVEDGTYCPNGYCQSGVCVVPVDIDSTEPVCTDGECCDLTTFLFKTKGTPCSNNPCQSGSTCMGNSNQCPPPATNVLMKDGTACPDGTCLKGLCKPIVECEEGECCRAGRLLTNYTSCSVGKCFGGKCIYDKVCIGDCCEKTTTSDEEPKAVLNGTPCKEGLCLAGQCRSLPPCFGECCANVDGTVAKVDGLPCNTGKGQCQKGMCVTPSISCAEGQCCNAFTGYLFPGSFPCHADPCKKSMPCMGNSPICIASSENKEDGYPCPGNGVCEKGICLLPPPLIPECTDGPCCDVRRNRFRVSGTPCGTDPCKEQTFCSGFSQYCPITLNPVEDGIICKQTLIGNWTCVDGICEKPKPKPVLPRCNVEKACCNTFEQRVYANGTLCAESFNECMSTAYCNGFDVECPINYRPDGSICTGGMCVHGQCILGVDPTDDDTTHEVHVHHTREGNNELVKITTTRKSDGSTFTKEHLIETDQIMEAKKIAEEKAMKAVKETLEAQKAEKDKIRQEQFEKDVVETMRRIEEEEQKKIDNMSRAELAEYEAEKNKTSTTPEHQQKENEEKKTPEEEEDEASEHIRFVDTLEHEGNPIRHLRSLSISHAYQQCATGLCCNKRTNVFFPYGHICGQPQNDCKVAICSGQSAECYPINVVDGFVCPNGKCFDGECIKQCYGECCDGRFAKQDGSECESNGKCFNGVCVRPCFGDCCEVEQNFAKPDGAPCMEGTCSNGRCIAEATSNGITQKTDPLNGQKAIAVIVDETKKTTDLESMWGKLINDEEAVRKANKEKFAKEQQAAHDAKIKAVKDETASQQAALLKAQNDNKDSKKYWTYGLIGGGGFVAFLLLILLIVVVAKHSGNKEKAKKDAQDSEYYYEKF